MKLFKCIISDNEMFSDVYKIKITEDGIFYEVEGKTVVRKEGDLSEELFGGNASADEPTESFDSSTTSGVDIILNHKLVEVPFNKKDYLVYLKGYVNAIVDSLTETNPDRVAVFKKAVNDRIKKIVKELSEFQFFIGENMDPTGMVALLNYREDGTTPYMLFFKDGLVEEKL
ncbi:translationally-controlled tumor protein homolog [Genypterus blacodes]|uniref:translationally-controlled tumor protein homolog n=1 Tax=Genypterus blacodes TaxID=154954 RepID=UPI003F75C084